MANTEQTNKDTLESTVNKRLSTGESFKKIEKDLKSKGYLKSDIEKITRKSDHYKVYSAYSVLYFIVILLFLVGIFSSFSDIFLGIILFFEAIIFLLLGILTSRSHIIALYLALVIMVLLLISNILLDGNILGVLVGVFFLIVATRSVQPMRRILSKGHKVTRAF